MGRGQAKIRVSPDLGHLVLALSFFLIDPRFGQKHWFLDPLRPNISNKKQRQSTVAAVTAVTRLRSSWPGRIPRPLFLGGSGKSGKKVPRSRGVEPPTLGSLSPRCVPLRHGRPLFLTKIYGCSGTPVFPGFAETVPKLVVLPN